MVGLIVGIAACDPPVPGQISQAPCDAAVCGDGAVRICGDKCTTPVGPDGGCDILPDCYGTNPPRLCAANLRCSYGVCVSASLQTMSACTPQPANPAADTCPSGTYCSDQAAYNPANPAGLQTCARRATEGASCSLPGGTTGAILCELGFSCVGGFCRRACSSGAQCPCGLSCGTIASQSVCAQCWSSTGVDNYGRPLRCERNSMCCGGSECVDSVLFITPATPLGSCCRPQNATCDANSPCCFGYTCNANGVCTVGCGPTGGQCTPNSTACTNLLTSNTHCGACNAACTSVANASNPRCEGGLCVGTCNTHFANCDGNWANGCETDLRTSTAHCGACRNGCATNGGTASCSDGNCEHSCPSGYMLCNNASYQAYDTSAACGTCGNFCASPGNCTNGQCTHGSCMVVTRANLTGNSRQYVNCAAVGFGPQCCVQQQPDSTYISYSCESYGEGTSARRECGPDQGCTHDTHSACQGE